MSLLAERLKQSVEAAREASAFFKKRAALEEEYAHGMLKHARASSEMYNTHEVRAGTYGNAWKKILKTHEVLAENRFRFSTKLTAISDDLSVLARDAERARRENREMGSRLERNVLDCESSVERARGRFDIAAEDLERVMLVKNGDPGRAADMSIGTAAGRQGLLGKSFSRGGLLFKNKSPQQILRHEDEFRAKKSSAHDALVSEAHTTQQVRHEYFAQHLPRVLRALKEALDEVDAGLQYHLMRYAFLYESIVLSDGVSVNPAGDHTSSTGLREAVCSVNNQSDFREYLQSYELAYGRESRGPQRENPYDDATLASLMYASPLAPAGTGAAGTGAPGAESAGATQTFGVDLATQLARDGVEVPPILQICTDAIERLGMQSMGIYRLSGTKSRVAKLKEKFDTDWTTVDLLNEEAASDINIVAGCLKTWFRELPEPLLTYTLYPAFIEAAKVENDYLRQIRLHEQVNELPDANYATLRFLMGHLDRVRANESMNQMSAHNLAIVFGPTLLRSPNDPASKDKLANASGGPVDLQDMNYQCKAIETILLKYRDIFVEGDE